MNFDLDFPTLVIIACGIYGIYALGKGFILLRRGSQQRRAAEAKTGGDGSAGG